MYRVLRILILLCVGLILLGAAARAGLFEAKLNISPERNHKLSSLLTIGMLVGIIIVGSILFILWQGVKDEVLIKEAALKGAAFELLKLMENAGPGGAEARAGKAEDTNERFAVKGAAMVAQAERPPALIGTAGHLDRGLTKVAGDLALLYRTDSASFRRDRGRVRTGALMLLALVGQGNLFAVRSLMIDYITTQLPEKLNSMPNYSLLKRFLDLPEDWPEERPSRNWAFYGIQTSKMALSRARHQLFADLTYRAPAIGGRPSVLLRGADVVPAIREFIRSDDTAQAVAS